MSLVTVFVHVILGTAILVGVASVGIIGWARLAELRRDLRPRLRTALPYVALLGSVLLVNSQLRTAARELSWHIGVEITAAIFAVEGEVVPWIQSFAWPPLTTALSAIYVYGYVFLLTFPLVAYFALEDDQPFRETCLAYSYNYALGLVLYVIFIAYGPRNLLPALVESLMYTSWPESQLLTSQINTNTNVFPSLHASLSTTVVLLAVRTRRTYPRWLSLSSGLAAAVMLSTMYLGIHWATDVLVGIALGVGSVAAAERWDPVRWVQRRVGKPGGGHGLETIGGAKDD